MKFPCSHKTVIVLDHGPQFAQPCHSVEFDVQRVRGNQMYSLYSCTVLYCTVLYCTVLYCTVLYCTLNYMIPFW